MVAEGGKRTDADRRALLRSLELLDTLADDALAALEGQLHWVEVPAGGEVFREGDDSDAVYFVAQGRLAVLQREPSGVDRRLREVGAGQPVGELGLLLDRPRSATATALRDSLLARLDRSGFERLIERKPAALLSLSRRIAERLVTGGPLLREGAPGAALVVAASPSVGLDCLWRELAPKLTAQGARCTTGGELARACGSAEGVEPARAARWLEGEARDGRPVFVLGEDRPSVLRLAEAVDRTVLVADSEERPGLGPLVEHVARLRERGIPLLLDLVLLQRRDRPPAATAAWLDAVQPARHHHLRRGDPDDLARLTRRLTGRAVGLALGGGGARAFAHIGAIRALREAKVPIDLVVGTNIGAVIGGQLALGWEPERMLEVNRREWPRVGRDFSLPFVSLLGARTLRGVMERMFGDRAIEDLLLEFRCSTVDLSWCRPVAHRRGPLQRWVRASVTLPGVHPPVVHDGRLYVDGALLENVPSAVAREAGAGTVISVDPTPFRRQTIEEGLDRAPTALGFLLDRLPLVGTGFPGILSLIQRSLSVAQLARHEEHKALSDLYVEPPVDRFGITDYSRVREISEFGYEETRRRLERDGPPSVG